MILGPFLVATTVPFIVCYGTKFFYKKIDSHAFYSYIVNNGLYHITTEEAAKQIVESKEIRASSHFASYGNKKSFFFGGVPSFESLCINSDLKRLDYIITAVKIQPTFDQLAKFRYRKYNDLAVTYDGSCPLDDKDIEIVKLGMFLKNNKIEYKELSEEEVRTYKPTAELVEKIDFSDKFKAVSQMLKLGLQVDLVRVFKRFADKIKDENLKLQKDNPYKNLTINNFGINEDLFIHNGGFKL